MSHPYMKGMKMMNEADKFEQELDFFIKKARDEIQEIFACREKIKTLPSSHEEPDTQLCNPLSDPRVKTLVEKADRVANWTIGGTLIDDPENSEKYPILAEALLDLRSAVRDLKESDSKNDI